jgi:hypothetical protein
VALTDRATFDELANLMCIMWLEGGEQRVKCLLDTLVPMLWACWSTTT